MSDKHPTKVTLDTADIPVGDFAGFFKYFRYDFISGLLVFSIALPFGGRLNKLA